MSLSKDELIERKKLAKEFMEAMAQVDLSHESDPDRKRLNKIEQELRRQGLLSMLGTPRKGGYVIRNQIHGGPLLLDNFSGELVFRDLDFAKLCLEAHPKAYQNFSKTQDCEILQIKT